MSKRHSLLLFSFSAGLVVGLVSISISIILKVFAGGLFLPELTSQTLFSLTPGEFESQAIETLGPLAKYSTFIASIIVTTIIFGIFGNLLDKLFYKFNLNRYILKFVSSFMLTYGILILISILMVTIIQVRSRISNNFNSTCYSFFDSITNNIWIDSFIILEKTKR